MATYEDVCTPQNKSKIFKCDKHAVNLLKNIQVLYEEQQLFDIVLIAGAERIKVQAHRFVLLLTCKYFRSMFRANLQEATATEIELKEIDGDILKLIVEFLYTGSIELRTETVEGIFKAADYFQLPNLIFACWQFIGNQLDVHNCIGISRFAQHFSLTELYKQSSDFACKNLEKVCHEEEFLQMTSTQLKELLASDDAPLASEELVFRSVMAWINHEKVNRADRISDLLSVVRFSLLTPQFISEHVVPICETMQCMQLILKWFQWHHLPSCRSNFSHSFHSKPIRAYMKAFVLSGADTNSWQIQTFDRELNVWSCQDLKKTLRKISGFGAKLKNGKLIITGGCYDKDLKTVDCLDLMALKWTSLPSMREPRSNHAMTELGGNLYVIGGTQSNDVGGSPMEMYDFTAKKWKDLAPAPLKMNSSSIRSTVINGIMYVCYDDNLLCYDPVKNDWAHLGTDVCIRENGFVAVGDYLYSVGGLQKHHGFGFDLNPSPWRSSDNFKRFNTLTKELKTLPKLNSPKSSSACFALNGRLVVCGGDQDDGTRVEEYDPETNKWTVLASMVKSKDHYVRNSL